MKKRTSYIICALVAVLILGGIFLLSHFSHRQSAPTPAPVSDPVDAAQQNPEQPSGNESPADPAEAGSEDAAENDPGTETSDEIVLEYDEDQGFTIG